MFQSNSPYIIQVNNQQSTLYLLLANVVKFFITFLGIFTLGAALGILKGIKKKKGEFFSKFTYFFIAIALLIFVLFGRGTFFGATLPKVLPSFSQIRYYLLIYILFIPYTIYFVKDLGKRVKIFVIFSLVLLSLNISFTSIGQVYAEMASENQVRQYLLKYTETDSIVFAQLYDRAIFPERLVVDHYGNGVDPQSVRLLNTVKLAKKLLQNKYKVYFLKEDVGLRMMKERDYIYFEKFKNAFQENKIEMTQKAGLVYKLRLATGRSE